MQWTLAKAESKVERVLLELNFPLHLAGYNQLMCGIPRFALDEQQSLSWELYPYIAEQLHYTDGRTVEHSIRTSVKYAWEKGKRAAWEKYFPDSKRVPTNKQFIATIAKYIK